MAESETDMAATPSSTDIVVVCGWLVGWFGEVCVGVCE